jgi:hypothetical protein
MNQKETELAYLRVLMVEERKTTNTQRYEEIVTPGEQEVIGYLYLKKKALVKIGNPRMVTITIHPGRSNG